MTAREIILSMAREFYRQQDRCEQDLKLSEVSNNIRTYQRVKQLLDGFNTQKSQRSQTSGK